MVRKYRVTVAGRSYEVEVEELGSQGIAPRSSERVQPASLAASAKTAPSKPRPTEADGVISSPLPGKVLAVKIQVGQKVKRGDLLLVIEAMKMENEIYAGQAGTLRKVHVAAGQNVETGDLLAELTPGD
jgi:biotin carboxyl carrier protein